MSYPDPIPPDAVRAVFKSAEGAVSILDYLAAMFEFTVSQLQPSFARMEKELLSNGIETPIDCASFALGFMVSQLAREGTDVFRSIHAAPVQWAEFLTRAAAMQNRVVCAATNPEYPSVTCGEPVDHEAHHGAGRLRW